MYRRIAWGLNRWNFMLIDTPVLALTGTASTKMTDHVKKSLSMKKGTLTIFVSPNRENIRLSVVKVKREKYLANLSWLVSIMQEKREETPKTIIFCNTIQDMASVLGYLLNYQSWRLRLCYWAGQSTGKQNCGTFPLSNLGKI